MALKWLMVKNDYSYNSYQTRKLAQLKNVRFVGGNQTGVPWYNTALAKRSKYFVNKLKIWKSNDKKKITGNTKWINLQLKTFIENMLYVILTKWIPIFLKNTSIISVLNLIYSSGKPLHSCSSRQIMYIFKEMYTEDQLFSTTITDLKCPEVWRTFSVAKKGNPWQWPKLILVLVHDKGAQTVASLLTKLHKCSPSIWAQAMFNS